MFSRKLSIRANELRMKRVIVPMTLLAEPKRVSVNSRRFLINKVLVIIFILFYFDYPLGSSAWWVCIE